MITISDIQTYKGITITNTAFYNNLISYVTAMINSITNRTLTVADYTEYLNGEEFNILSLKNYPVNTLTSISYVDKNGVATIINSTDYSTDLDSGEITFDYNLCKGIRNYKVIYNAGYATIPNDLKLIALQILTDIESNINKNTTIKSESLGDYSYTLANQEEIKNNYKNLLSKYIKY